MKQRYRNNVKNSRGYPGADADTYHVLVKMNIKITLKSIKGKKMQEKWNHDKLKNKIIQEF